MGFYRVREPIEARRVDCGDYDGLIDILRWCGGKPLGPDEFMSPELFDGAVIEVPNGYGDQRASDGQWIVKYTGDHGYGVFDDADFHSKYVEVESGKVESGKVETVVAAVLDDLRGRRGYRQAWDGMDDDTREELVSDLEDVVANALGPQADS